MATVGLYYYNARWYNPYLNRFLSPDSIVPDPYNPLDWDRYSYVRNNPVNNTDPTGHMIWDGCTGETGGCGDANTYADYVYSVWHTDQEREQNNENQQTAVDIGTTVIGIENEPADWAMTISACVSGNCSPWALVGLVPGIPGSAGKKVGNIIEKLPIPKPKGGVDTLLNPDGKVVRVGHTKDFVSRRGNYRRDPNYVDLDFNLVYATDDYATRRGLEQMVYDLYQPPLNRNRPIRIENPNSTGYLSAATSRL